MNFAIPGALSKRPGTANYVGATVSGEITGAWPFERLNGASYLVVTANTNAYTVTNSFNAFNTGLKNNAIFDFVTFVDRLFACNGHDYFKYDGSNVAPFSLPAGYSGWGVTAIPGGSLTTGGTGTFLFSYGYINERGFYGPAAPGITITIFGGSYNSVGFVGLSTPSGFGATAIALYRTSPGGVDLFGTTLSSAGSATVTDTGFPLTARPEPAAQHFTLAPRYLEIYNNQLFMAGFSSMLSTAYWSQIGEPEGIEPEFFAEFRTNDGDRITGMKSYAGSIIVFKERSFHRLTGDNPENFLNMEISDQYGCLSNRAIVAFEDRLWFLDSKGIAEYNGAGVRIVSTKIQDVFERMNVAAARDKATAVHNRELNEVWFSIPVDGSSINNLIVSFDYATSQWTTYEGLNAALLFRAKATLPIASVFTGGYTGALTYFSASLMSDLGQAITCMILPPFVAPTGQTTERQYRRFYLDLVPILGFTNPISINFRLNYGASVHLARTIYQNQFQTRLDFGLPAKSIQPEIIHSSATFGFVVNGYAFESRYQRGV